MARITPANAEQLIFVDESDNELGYVNKSKCHDGDGLLHRAFSLFIFTSSGKLLLQQRSADKRLWPLFWSNSCCGHPIRGETMAQATDRRLDEELGIAADLEFVYKFSYQARFGNHGSENELCSVFLGSSDEAFLANPQEIADARYVTAEQLDQELKDSPEMFTPWFKMEWERLSGDFSNKLASYLQ